MRCVMVCVGEERVGGRRMEQKRYDSYHEQPAHVHDRQKVLLTMQTAPRFMS
jgi:hypothetical protein